MIDPDFGVSRETRAGLNYLVDELRRWQASVNLVAPSTLPDVWTRHVADSLQLQALIDRYTEDQDGHIVDIGSGGGFPGLVLAIASPRRRVTLIDSDARKCAFLRHVAREVAPNATVRTGRAETILATLPGAPAAITARGVASLSALLALTETLLRTGTFGLFPKGRSYEAELTAARKGWRFDVAILPSTTDADARILRVTNLSRVTDAPFDA